SWKAAHSTCSPPTTSPSPCRRASSLDTTVSGLCYSIPRSRRSMRTGRVRQKASSPRSGSPSATTSNPRFVELVGELALSSERFRTLWARHDVNSLEGGTTTVNHPVVGRLRLHRDKLPVGDVLLVVYYADHGSESDEKLRLLGSLARKGYAASAA